MTENTKQLLDRAAQYLIEPYHPVTDDKYKVGVSLVMDLRNELLKATNAKSAPITATGSTDIRKAIADLRDAINGGEGWPTIHRAYDALDKSVLERYGVNNPIDAMRQLDWALTKSATGTFVNVETYLKQLEEAVWVPSVTVIQAARDVISQSGPIIINEGRSNEVEVYTTDEKAIAVLRSALDALASSVEGGTVEAGKAYVVYGSTGEYSDHREWYVRAFTSEDAAQKEVIRLTERGNAHVAKFGKYVDRRNEAAVKDLAEFDPDFDNDYTGFNYNYATVDLITSPTPSLTDRIEAAEEEIRKAIHRYAEHDMREESVPYPDITAIIRRHLEVK